MALTKKEMAAALEDLLNQFDSTRARWVEQKGSDEGHSAWFTQQVKELMRPCFAERTARAGFVNMAELAERAVV